jgi:endonuclease G
MQVDNEIVAITTERLDRLHGSRLKAPPVAAPGLLLPADRRERVARYINENRTPDDTAALERAFGTNDLVNLYYFWAGIRAARSVGMIRISPGPGDPGGFATGFMIAPNLLLTNWHVFKTAETASRARVEFAFEADASGNERTPTWFSFRPQFFINNKDLDYCVVAVDPGSQQGPETLESFGWLRLNPQLGKTDYGQFLSIIQHPGGQSKQAAIRENKLLPFDDADNFLTYQSDTFRGSSGSPAFNDLWAVVALHHSGKPLKDAQGHYVGHDGQPITDHKPQENEIKWIANEGVRTSKIVADFRARAPHGPELDTLEATFNGDLAAKVASIEIDLGQNTAPEKAPVQTAVQPANLPERGFTVTLPLNVSLRVESISERPAAALAQQAPSSAPQPSAPRPAEPAEIEFEKLNFDTDYSDRSGYDEDFLGRDRRAAMPEIDSGNADQVAPSRRRGSKILHYHHFSVMIHAKRKMPVLSAGNVDYSKGRRGTKDRKAFGKDEWRTDSRMEEKYQLPRGFYDRWKKLDYGHLVRRDDNCWGASASEIEFANADTFHLTNCTPQHEAFNRDKFGFHGLWGRLENHISTQATGDRALARLCIFAGPIFSTRDLKLEDEELGNVYVPLAFWKVVVAPTSRGSIRAFGFITSQKQDLGDEPPFEEFTPEGFTDEQALLAKIEDRTIVRFSDDLKKVDTMLSHPDGNEIMPLTGVEEIWMGQL